MDFVAFYYDKSKRADFSALFMLCLCVLWLLFLDSVNFPEEKGYESGVFNKYDFQTLRLLKIKHIIIIVMAATTTTNSQGKRLATNSPDAKDITQPAFLCFISLTPILHNIPKYKKCYKYIHGYIDFSEHAFYNIFKTFVRI